MKIKLSFVSNSSSVSYFVWGVRFDWDEIPKTLFEELKKQFPDEDFDTNDTEDTLHTVAEALQSLLGSQYKVYSKYDDCEDIVIGRCPSNMRDDQTLGEFKQEISDQLKKIGIKNSKCSWQEDCWHD